MADCRDCANYGYECHPVATHCIEECRCYIALREGLRAEWEGSGEYPSEEYYRKLLSYIWYGPGPRGKGEENGKGKQW